MENFDNKFVSGNSLTYLANKTKEYIDENISNMQIEETELDLLLENIFGEEQ